MCSIFFTNIVLSFVECRLLANLSPESEHATDNSKIWLVYIDGSVAKIGLGAGTLIIDSTLVLRLQLACQLGANDLIIHTNSQLVAKQVNGEYNVKEAVLKKYHTMATQLLTGFKKDQIK
ncbi:Retrovirus-related Pol polyprotein from transposon 297 family [Gossypium australe]|uniref:Retrovirus-related Pol polyprotein from transposon 297 family n=1 Tax=Gossypium australe TaxID=47621 RepID=A0A5B6W6H4_9ROSI|nr:Retrovirus-related Pol polyprotein from transposon 297 family [Gossypium australe]